MRTIAGAAAALAVSHGVHATLTKPLPQYAGAGTKLVVAFTLRDAAGRPFDASHVFVKVICPEKTDSSLAYARDLGRGRYRAVAIVPPGGLGRVRVGLRGAYFPIG
jgi:hypothetical protein